MYKESRGLPGGPNEYITHVSGLFDIYQAPSNIEGQGMFTGKPFKKGDLIGLAHSNDQPASQLGRMHNHDENSPTMISKKSGNDRFVFAAKDLQPGDELTTNYRMQPELEQPEQFQNGGSVMVPPRQGVRKNPDGTESTHLMATETLDGKNWFSFPTLFQDPDGTWIDMSDKPWKEAYEEAKKRGELIDFGTDKEAAIKFGEGSWKPKMKRGGGLLTQTMKCNSCGWKWKAADGGSDLTTCHKCGGEAKIKAQDGKETSQQYFNFAKGGPTDPPERTWSEKYQRMLTLQELSWLDQKFSAAKEVTDLYKAGNKEVAENAKLKYKEAYGDSFTCPNGQCDIPVGYNEGTMPILEPTHVDHTLQKFIGSLPENEEEIIMNEETTEPEGYADETEESEDSYYPEQTRKGFDPNFYIDMHGKRIDYRLPKFRKPGNYGDLIKKGKQRHLYIPSIERGPSTSFMIKAQDGKETSWSDYINPMNWGVTNRDDAGDFKQAFRAARIDGDDEFMWHGERYSTELKAQPKVEAKPAAPKPKELNIEGLKKGIAQAESLGGVLMLNPESTATGLYGQRFSELKGKDIYKGTREDFAKDLEAQNRVFELRLNQGIDGTKGLIKDAEDIYNEYAPQIKNFQYSKEDLVALTNFLGRQGTRQYLGYHVRDKKPLSDSLPSLYSNAAKQANKTPDQYLKIVREYYQDGGEIDEFEMYKNYIDGKYDGTDMEEKASKVYDKLNRVYYKQGKESGTTIPNYILSTVINQTNKA